MAQMGQQVETDSYACGGRIKKMPNGGLMPVGPNAELQRGEPFMSPAGKINGISKSAPTHAQGGVKGRFEEGTKVLGKEKNPETGNKFQDDGNKLKTMQKKAEKTLKISKNRYARNSAMLNKRNAVNKFDALFEKQQMITGNNNGQEYAYGGRIPKANDGLYVEDDPKRTFNLHLSGS